MTDAERFTWTGTFPGPLTYGTNTPEGRVVHYVPRTGRFTIWESPAEDAPVVLEGTIPETGRTAERWTSGVRTDLECLFHDGWFTDAEADA